MTKNKMSDSELLNWCGDSGWRWANALTDMFSENWIDFDGFNTGAWTSLNRDAMTELLHVWFANAIEHTKTLTLRKAAGKEYASEQSLTEQVQNLRKQLEVANGKNEALINQLEQLQKAQTFGAPTYNAYTITPGTSANGLRIDRTVAVAEIKNWFNSHTNTTAPVGFTPTPSIPSTSSSIRCYDNIDASEKLIDGIAKQIAQQIADDIDKDLTEIALGELENGSLCKEGCSCHRAQAYDAKQVTAYTPGAYIKAYEEWSTMESRPFNKAEWPGECDKCGGPAYVGANIVDCYKKCNK